MGTFIISLDCEGKWGMADHLEPYHHRLLTDRALAEVYDRIVALLARYDLPATFAYVMAFTLTEAERRELAPLLVRQETKKDAWLSHYWAAEEQGLVEGWFQPHALDVVREDGRHEIACHGFCHRPLGDNSLSAADAETELEAAATVARMKGVDLKTLIFPRNEVGHLALVRKSGFIGYREKLRRPSGVLGRAARVAEEFNIWAGPQEAKKPVGGDMVEIPPGYFFNWRFGVRKRVPLGVTVARWKKLLDRAARHGGVAHLWLHPHNLITGPDTAESLAAVIAYAAALRAGGKLEVMTQEQFSDKMRAS